jgi:Xaa-Pro aminopeptidase
VRYFAWLEEQLNQGVELSESQGADQLEKFRRRVSHMSSGRHSDSSLSSQLPLFKGLSFTTISSTGPNGGVSSLSLNFVTSSALRNSDHPLLTGPK